MAFSTKYQVQFKDYADSDWDIYFREDGFVGDITQLTPGGDPLHITWDSSDKYQTIVGSYADIQVVYNSDCDGLYVEESDTMLVIITKDATSIWQGYLSPGQYTRHFNQPIHYVTFTASDMLGELKSIKFEDGSGDPYFGQAQEIVVIYNILEKTGLSLNIREAVNIFDANHTTGAAYSPLNQTYLYQEAYWDEQTDERSNCYVVLEDILKKYGASIRQYNSIWRILRANSFSVDTIYYRTFASGVYGSNSSYTSYTTLGATHFYIHADQELTKQPGVGICEVTQNPPRRTNMFKNGSFNSFTWDSGVPIYWTDVYTSGTTLNMSEDNNQLKMGACGNAAIPTEYIEYSTTVDFATSINVSLDWTPTFTGSPTYKSLVLQVYSVTFAKYLVTAGTWQAGVGYITSTAGASGAEIHFSFDIPDEGTGFGRGNTIRFRIYEFYCEQAAATNYLHLNNLRMEVDMSKPETRMHSYSNSITVNNIEEKEIAWGDSWRSDFGTSTSDYSYFINTYAESVTGSLTTLWSITGDPTAAAKIGTVLARQTVEGFRRSLDVISGSLKSPSTGLSIITIIDPNFTDEYGFTKRFFPLRLDFNVRMNEWDGNWIECPATYTDLGLEWASSTYSDYSIAANQAEVNDSAGDAGFVLDDYTCVAGETIRIILELTDDGSSDMPYLYIEAVEQPALSWGTNLITYRHATAAALTIGLGHDVVGENHNYTAVINVYGITGI